MFVLKPVAILGVVQECKNHTHSNSSLSLLLCFCGRWLDVLRDEGRKTTSPCVGGSALGIIMIDRSNPTLGLRKKKL